MEVVLVVENVALPIRGSCQCGNIKYVATALPRASLACHCIECQKLTSSAYSTVLVFEADAISFEGDLACWERVSDSGRRNQAYFCPTCGNRIYHFDPEMPSVVRLKSGTIDSSPIPAPQANQWISRKPDWVILDEDVPTYPDGMSPEARKALVGFGFRPDD
jgi:hypothetical protein